MTKSRANAAWYEAWFNKDYLKLYAYRDRKEAQAHVEFVRSKLAMPKGSRVLDLGCGAGRHTLWLAEHGYDVVGIDRSETLIAEAKLAAQRHGLGDLELHIGDMRHLDSYGSFDYILSFFTSFGYFETPEEDATVLKSVAAALRSGGHFVLDFLHPDQVKRNLVLEETRDIDGETVRIERSIREGVAIKRITFPTRSYEERVRLYTRAEVEAMLGGAGLSVVNVWSDYSGNPWTEQGPRQIFHALKTK